MGLKNYFLRPPVLPNLEDWPIYKLHQKRRQFVEDINTFTVKKMMETHTREELVDMLSKTIYNEKIRIKEEPWKVDPPDERQFFSRIQKTLINDVMDDDDSKDELAALLYKVVNRYSEEIIGTFKISTFQFARRFLTLFFGRLLNTAASRNLKRFYNTSYRLHQRLIAVGEIDQIRALATKGTVVMVPTHFSNLDSILIGYVMDAILGLPSSHYGAGLNLYNTGYTAYFMNRLGAYRLDRRKKNSIYLETLKSMSNLALQEGTNSLFFPGGTRSRSGQIETRLKLGLLGTTVEAQRALLQKGSDQKLFIVPVVLGYNVVLEAKSLMEQHLKRTGRERYINDKNSKFSIRRLLRFAWNVFARQSDIILTFGKPLDVLGNFVDQEGRSLDRFGKEVQLRDYFLSGNEINADTQREEEYTKILADRIVERYHKENYALASHLVAWVVFYLLKKADSDLDLYGLLRQPTEDFVLSAEEVIDNIDKVQQHLFKMEAEGRIKCSPNIKELTPEELLKIGIADLGVYHAEKAVAFNKEGAVISENFRLLFYYHNRLVNYRLEEGLR